MKRGHGRHECCLITPVNYPRDNVARLAATLESPKFCPYVSIMRQFARLFCDLASELYFANCLARKLRSSML